MIPTLHNFLPFVETHQYHEFASTCDYARKYKVMALVHGKAGAGKTASARHYVSMQPRIIANGQSSMLYFQLAQSDKTDRSFANTLVAAITKQDVRHHTASVAMSEAKRLIAKFRYEGLIIDEVGFLQASGLEAVRTLHDLTKIPIILITMPSLVEKLEQYPQFYSRISQFLTFESLNKDQIKHKILPRISASSYICFDARQDDADEIVNTLFKVSNKNFRDLIHILQQVDELIHLSIQQRSLLASSHTEETLPQILSFDAELIKTATAFAKGRTEGT